MHVANLRKRVVTLVLALLATACSNSPSALKTMADREMPSAEPTVARAAPAFGEGAQASSAGSATASPALALGALAASQADRQLIKNATVIVETEDSRAATDQLMAGASAIGGYVGEMQESVDGLGRRSVTIQIRVPADKFDASMRSLDSLGRIISKQVTTQDVTEEFVDTEARSRNLKKMEERLLDHLNRFGELKDILSVEKELTRVREDVERLDGRLRYLSHRVAFSTISVTLTEKPKAGPVTPVQSFSTAKVTTEAVRSLVEFGQGVWYYIIWIAVWSPVWAVLGLAAWIVGRRVYPKIAP